MGSVHTPDGLEPASTDRDPNAPRPMFHPLRRLCSILGIISGSLIGCTRPPSADLVIDHATLIASPRSQPVSNARIVIRDGRIVFAGEPRWLDPRPDAAQHVDAEGAVVLAGFWNSHVHFTEPDWRDAAEQTAPDLATRLQTMLTGYGFVNVVDTGSEFDNTRVLQRRVFSGEIRGPNILMAAGSFVPEGKPPIYVEDPLPQLVSAESAAASARDWLGRYPDGIKVFAGTYRGDEPPGLMPTEILKPVVDAAHRQGRWVMAHPETVAGLEASLAAGVDIAAHTTPGDPLWTASLVRRLVSSTALVPTLQLWQIERIRNGASPEVARTFQARGVVQLRQFHEAGGEVLFGTDVGYHSDYNPSEEYARMADAGMTFETILASLTTAPARRFDDAMKTGTIHVGKRADLVILRDDPRNDATAFARVRATLRAGELLYDNGLKLSKLPKP